ncbi:lipopolysaccharide biosynthesis protein [Actinomadura scrupuli]|uniref:lipopolysaccharide biosynthesis protein n=1 Tax=Actinomadura scrupuli TaxID=559629 RepID=UPI003D97E19D
MSVRLRKVAHTMLTSAVRFAVSGVMAIVIARTLGPQGRGGYAVLVTIAATAVTLGHLSIDASHTSLWANARARDFAAIATNSLLFGVVAGTLAAAASAIAVVALGPGIVPVPGYGMLALALLAIPCNLTVFYLNTVLVLRERIEAVNWSGVLAVCVPCVLLLVLAALGHPTLGSVVGLWTLSAAVPLAVLIPAVRPRLRDRDLALARRALGIGLRYHIGSTSLFLLLRADILILNAFAPAAAVGLYAVAVTLVELTRVGADAIAQVILSEQMDGDHDIAAALTARITRLNVLLAVGSTGLMCAAAPLLIPVVYGAAFGASVGPLLGLAPGLIALSLTRMISAFLLRLNRPVLRSGTAVVALVVNVALNLLLIPRYGIMGCAVASSVSYCALAGLYVLWFRKATGTPVRRLVPGRAELRYFADTWAGWRASSRSAGSAGPPLVEQPESGAQR